LILIASSCFQITKYIQHVTKEEQAKLQRDGAQAITYLMPAHHSTPRWLRGKHDTLAIRLTAHPFAKALCHSTGSALVSTSANRSGQRPAKTFAECQRLFGKKVWVLRGRVGKRKQPSTIRAWVGGKILRQ
jgi:L-threonylcarbamoyladenylate synthase